LKRAQDPKWSLVILGDGVPRMRLESLCLRLGVKDAVVMPGFRDYDELPVFYGLAGAFIHASTTEQWGLVVNEALASRLPVIVSNRCGCAPELVEAGRNGFTFNPYETEELVGLMLQVASMTTDERASMGHVSGEIISRWTPDTFAVNLIKTVEAALAAPIPRASVFDKALLWALIHRPSALRAI
jgi:glycosyltransferase involved in cell wall biosynthesis